MGTEGHRGPGPAGESRACLRVRRRRREFALLKTLGFTQRQLAATVAWQSSVPAIVGVIFGVPLGIACGRWLWTLFARGMSAVPDPNVPALYIAAGALGAIVFANLAAVFPGIIAAQQSFGLPQNNPTGLPAGDFALTVSDPNPCTTGFLPSPSSA